MRFGLSEEGCKSLRVRRDVSHECKTVEVKQLLLRREYFEFQKGAVSSMENVGGKRLSRWKKC